MTSAYKEQNVLTNLVITNWGKGVLQIGAAFLLQIGANAYYKLGKLFYYKLGKGLLQVRAGITNWDKVYYKLGQVLQIGAGITNWSKLLQIGAQQLYQLNKIKATKELYTLHFKNKVLKN